VIFHYSTIIPCHSFRSSTALLTSAYFANDIKSLSSGRSAFQMQIFLIFITVYFHKSGNLYTVHQKVKSLSATASFKNCAFYQMSNEPIQQMQRSWQLVTLCYVQCVFRSNTINCITEHLNFIKLCRKTHKLSHIHWQVESIKSDGYLLKSYYLARTYCHFNRAAWNADAV